MKKLFKKVLLSGLIAGATTLVGVGSFYVSRANASIDMQENKKHVLIATIGYMGGKPSGILWWRYNQEEPNTVILSFDDSASCEQAKSTLSNHYRDSVFNGACIVMPASGEIMQSKS